MPQHDSDSISAAASRKRRPRRAAARRARRLPDGTQPGQALRRPHRIGRCVAGYPRRRAGLPAGPRAAARPRCCAPSPGWNARTAASSRCPAATSPHAEPQERDYGILFQSYALFPNLTVAQNVAYGLSGKRAHRKHVAGRVEEMLTLVGLAGAANKYPGQISGGQQQRVAWPARWRRRRPCCCWTSPCRRWTPACATPAHRIARAAEAPVHHTR